MTASVRRDNINETNELNINFVVRRKYNLDNQVCQNPELLLLLKYHVSNITLFYTMATSSIQSNTTLFDQIIFTIINDLKNKHKRADVESIHKEIAKKSDFKDVTKEDLEERINIIIYNKYNKYNKYKLLFC